jgi:DNA-binding transcriptional LysR family regulator
MFDLGRHKFLTHTGYNKQRESWATKTPAWMEILKRSFQSNSSTVLLEACAAGTGICPMPSYVSLFEQRVVPLLHIPPLARLAYAERIRGLSACEAVLEWLREAFDAPSYPVFRETYVQLPSAAAAKQLSTD